MRFILKFLLGTWQHKQRLPPHQSLTILLFKDSPGKLSYIELGIKDITYHNDNDAQYPSWVHDPEHQLVTLWWHTALIN